MSPDHNTVRYGWIDCLHLLKSRWPILFLVCSLILLLGAAMRSRIPQLFESTTVVELAPGWNGLDQKIPQHSSTVRSVQSGGAEGIRAEIEAYVFLNSTLEDTELQNRLKIEDEADAISLLRSRIDVKVGQGKKRIQILARDRSPEAATELANLIASRYVDWKNAQEKARLAMRAEKFSDEVDLQNKRISDLEDSLLALKKESTASEEELKTMRRELIMESHLLRSLEAKSQLAMVEVSQAIPVANVVEAAVEEDAVREGNPAAFFSGLFLMGISLGSIVVVLTGIRRASEKVSRNLSRQLDIPIVEVAPVNGLSLIGQVDPEARSIEPYRLMRTRIHRLQAPDCMIVTCLADGKTPDSAEVVTNLAAVFADGGHTVLIIDSDFRSPRVHCFFEAASQPGLSDYLMGEMRMEETVVRTKRPNLWCMPSGPVPRDPCGLLTGRRMDDLLWNMKQRFDYIFMTAPPIRKFSDGSALASVSDHVFLICDYRDLSSSRIRRDRIAVEASGGILSTVLLSRSEGRVRQSKGKKAAAEQSVKVDVRPATIKPEDDDAAPRRISSAKLD